MVWDVIFIVQSSNPPCSFLTTFFFLHIVHFTLLSQFLSTCICHFCCYLLGTIRDYVNRIAIIWTWSRRLSISEAKRGLSWPNGRWPLWQHFKKGWVQIQTFSLLFWNRPSSPFVQTFYIWRHLGTRVWKSLQYVSSPLRSALHIKFAILIFGFGFVKKSLKWNQCEPSINTIIVLPIWKTYSRFVIYGIVCSTFSLSALTPAVSFYPFRWSTYFINF